MRKFIIRYSYPFYMFCVFLSGILVAINLTCLLPTNKEYKASWLKVTISIIFGIFFSIRGKKAAFKSGSKNEIYCQEDKINS